MAKAAYCSECGVNVMITPEGACPNGHGAECISNVYETPDVAPVAPVAEPAPVAAAPTPQGVPGTGAPQGVPGKSPERKGRSAVLIIGAAVLAGCVLVAGIAWVASAWLIPSGTSSTTVPGASSDAGGEAAQGDSLAVAAGFMKAMVEADGAALKASVPSAPSKDAGRMTWEDFTSGLTDVEGKIVSETREGDKLVLSFETADEKTTATLEPVAGTSDQVKVVAQTSSGPEESKMILVKEGGAWKVTRIEYPDGVMTFWSDGLTYSEQ